VLPGQPVGIGLRAWELQANPLRPGLSALVRIDTSKPGRSVLQPLTATPGDVYKTGVYEHQLDGAEALIHEIIENNRRSGKPEIESVTARKRFRRKYS
jgi:membrane fusion protein, multidrug efflux system